MSTPTLDLSIASPVSVKSPRNTDGITSPTGEDVDFHSLLSTSATRMSLQMGRDLRAEMAELERELESEIAQQMLEDEMEAQEQEDLVTIDEPLKPLKKAFLPTEAVEPNIIAAAEPVIESITSSIEPINSPLSVRVPHADSPPSINTFDTASAATPAANSSRHIKADSSNFEATSDFANDMMLASDQTPLVTPAAKSKRKSFMERAAELNEVISASKGPAGGSARPSMSPRSSTKLLSAMTSSAHKRSVSQGVADRLFMSPNSTALRECMKKAAQVRLSLNGSPATSTSIALDSDLASRFVQGLASPSQPSSSSTISSNVDSAFDGSTTDAQPAAPIDVVAVPSFTLSPPTTNAALRRVSLGAPGYANELTSIQRANATRYLDRFKQELQEQCLSNAELREKIATQEAQILQAGTLGQQLIVEMEEMDEKFCAELEEKQALLDSQRNEIERSRVKHLLTEKQNTDLKLALQETQDSFEEKNKQYVLLQTKFTVFEAASHKMRKELFDAQTFEQTHSQSLKDIHKERDNLREQMISMTAANEKLMKKFSHLEEEYKVLQLDHNTSLNHSESLQRRLQCAEKTIAEAESKMDEEKSKWINEKEMSDLTVAKLTAALEESMNELERVNFDNRTIKENVETLQKSLKSKEQEIAHLQTSAAASATSSTTGTSHHLRSPSSSLESAPKGRNLKLSSMKYSSLLSELENELQQDLASPRKAPINAFSSSDKENSISTAQPFTTPIAPHKRASSAPMAVSAIANVTKVVESIDEKDENVDEVETFSSFIRAATPSAASARKSMVVPSTPVNAPSQSLLKRPSSVQKLGNWISDKVAEAENNLRVLATLTISDSESDSEEQEHARRRSAAVKPLPPASSARGTATPRSDSVVSNASAPLPPSSTARSTPRGSGADERPDVLREYFHLATLAVKLSSADENIRACNFSVHTLYDEVLTKDIPFAKWHLWIEERLAQLSALAEGHEILRPRQLVLPMATPSANKTQSALNAPHTAGPALLPMPSTPASLSNAGKSHPSPLPIRSFENMTPQPSSKSVSRLSTPSSNAGGKILGENQMLVNQPNHFALQTPQASLAKSVPMLPGSAKSVASTPMGPGAGAAAAGQGSVHRPMVRGGVDRFQQRAQGTPSVAAATAATPAARVQQQQLPLHRASGSTSTGTSTSSISASSLFTKFTNFVTASPAPSTRIAPRV